MWEPSIDGFIQLVTLYNPNFPQQIQGADATQIAAFADLVYQVSAVTLPADYRDFLLRMGVATPGFVGDSWWAFVEDASLELESLQEYYGYLLEDGESPPPKCLIVGVGGLHCEEVFLECDGEIAGRVFSLRSDSRLYWAQSWVGHLYKRGCRYIMSKHLQIQAYNPISQEQALQLANFAIAYGLEVLWFSDAFDFCAVSSDREIWLYISSYTISPWFYLAGKKQSWSWFLGRHFSPQVADLLQFVKRRC